MINEKTTHLAVPLMALGGASVLAAAIVVALHLPGSRHADAGFNDRRVARFGSRPSRHPGRDGPSVLSASAAHPVRGR